MTDAEEEEENLSAAKKIKDHGLPKVVLSTANALDSVSTTKCLFCQKRTTRKLATTVDLSNQVPHPICCTACNADLDLIPAATARDEYHVTTKQLSTIPHVLCWKPSRYYGRKYKRYNRKHVEDLAARLADNISKRQIACDVLLALFTINRRAKRCRDLAQSCYWRGAHGLAGNYRREKETI